MTSFHVAWTGSIMANVSCIAHCIKMRFI